MTKVFSFAKNGYTFMFRNPHLDRYDELVCDYKIPGVKERDEEDGYYFNSTFKESKKAMTFYNVKIDGKEVAGVILPDDIYNELKSLKDKLLEDRKALIKKTADEIISGERLIDFDIVGCEYPHYQAWLHNLPDDIKDKVHEVLDMAIEVYTGEKFYGSSVDYLIKKLNQSIATIEKIHPKAVNLVLDPEIQKYYGFIETVVTSFQIKLADLIDINEVRLRQKKEEEKEQRRNSLKLEVVKKGVVKGEELDPYAVVKLTEPETGESLQFVCRNIFDFGYVINPDYEIAEGIDGGLHVKGKWQTFKEGEGWHDVRELTAFEKRCIEYLLEFPPISTCIRM